MALSKEEILDAIAEMSVMDIVALIEAMEEKFGVTAAAAVARYLMGHKSQSEIETDRDDNIKVGENDISNTNNRNEEKQ